MTSFRLPHVLLQVRVQVLLLFVSLHRCFTRYLLTSSRDIPLGSRPSSTVYSYRQSGYSSRCRCFQRSRRQVGHHRHDEEGVSNGGWGTGTISGLLGNSGRCSAVRYVGLAKRLQTSSRSVSLNFYIYETCKSGSNLLGFG